MAINEGNSPFAAILVDEQGNIIERAHNTAKSMCNPVLHAEINLISEDVKNLIQEIYQNIIYGAPSESDMNHNVTIFDIKEKSVTDVNIETGILKEECQLQIENVRKNIKIIL